MFCPQCGTEVTSGIFCTKCGTKVGDQPPEQEQQQQPPPRQVQPQQPPPQSQPPLQQPGYQQRAYTGGGYSSAPRGHYAPGSFIERLHSHGGSVLFLAGIILFTAGRLFSQFMSFGGNFLNNFFSLISLLLLALPVAGFWLIYVSSKAPRRPEKALTALTLFKVSVIIDLVLKALLALGLLFLAFMLFAVGDVFVFFGFVTLFAAGGIAVFTILYVAVTVGVIDGIAANINNNTFTPLPRLGIFSILSFVGVGFTALTSIIGAAAVGFFYDMVRRTGMPRELVDMILGRDFSAVVLFGTLFTLVACGGTVVCIIALNQLNRSLSGGGTPGTYIKQQLGDIRNQFGNGNQPPR